MRTGWMASALVTALVTGGWAAPFSAKIASERSAGAPLERAVRLAGEQTSQTCFDSTLTLLLNPACFQIDSPPSGGDCVSRQSHFFVQYFTPTFATPHRVVGFGFVSNDGSTVFPSAGVVLIPVSENRFPTPAELQNLQVDNVPTPHDTAVVIVDLQSAPGLVVTSGTDVVVCLQFPEGGELGAVGSGPGIAVDETLPDQACDFFTHDTGATFATNQPNDPLDWGFEIVFEPVTAVTPLSWSELKRVYRVQEPAALYRVP